MGPHTNLTKALLCTARPMQISTDLFVFSSNQLIRMPYYLKKLLLAIGLSLVPQMIIEDNSHDKAPSSAGFEPSTFRTNVDPRFSCWWHDLSSFRWCCGEFQLPSFFMFGQKPPKISAFVEKNPVSMVPEFFKIGNHPASVLPKNLEDSRSRPRLV